MSAPTPQKRPAYEPPARLLSPARADPHMRRPVTIVAGTVLVLLRVVAGAIAGLRVLARRIWTTPQAPERPRPPRGRRRSSA